MEQGAGLSRVYQGEYTVYHRDSMYCFLKGSLELESLSLSESFSMGGQYIFCPSAFEGQEALSNFIENAIAYFKRWNRRILFLWIENPEDRFYQWHINKLEEHAGSQGLAFDCYRLQMDAWDSLAVEAEEFIFSYRGARGYAFRSPALALPGADSRLHLKTMGELCGALFGSLLLQKERSQTAMELLDAGICYDRIMKEDEPGARARGFVSHTVNHVLIPEGELTIAFQITPQLLYHPDKTRFGLYGNTFSTHFAVNTGKSVSVKADTDAALVFQQRPVLAYRDKEQQLHTRKRLYLGIEGSFQVLEKDVKLLCGLSGTETMLLKDFGKLRFQSSMPAVCPYEDAALGTTSWVGNEADGDYYCQPQNAALYAALSNRRLRFLEVPSACFSKRIPAVPMIPFRGLSVNETQDIFNLEESLYQKRRELLLGTHGNAFVMSLSENIRACTPQGLMAEVTPQGKYCWIGFANLSENAAIAANVPQMCFTNIDEETKRCFLKKELLYVVDTAKKLEQVKPSNGFCFSIEDILFSLLPDAWRSRDSAKTMMLFQYSAQKSMADALPDHEVLQQAIKNAYTSEGEIKDGYQELIQVVQDANFQGILALNVTVSLKELPAEIKFLMNSVDTEKFYAAYLIIRAGGIEHDPQDGLILKQSKVSGLVDYTTDRKLIYDKAPPDYDYLTTEIKIQIQESRIVSFISSSEVLINRLFDAKAASQDNPDGNCLVLQGRLVEKDDAKIFQYNLKQCVAYQLSGSGILDVWIQTLELVVGDQDEGRFMLSGVLSCQKTEGADLLGYGGEEPQQGLPFSQLELNMQKGAKESAPVFSMEYGQLNFDRAKAVLRKDSFPNRFAVYLESVMVERAGESLEQKGYLSITAPVRQGVPGAAYQGLVWSIAVGSMGGLSSQESIVLQLVTAFWQGENEKTEYYVGIRLPGVFSGNGLKLQGVFKLGFGSISMEYKEPEYQIKLHNFHVEILGASLPRRSSDIFLFSDGEHVGWYAAYEEG